MNGSNPLSYYGRDAAEVDQMIDHVIELLRCPACLGGRREIRETRSGLRVTCSCGLEYTINPASLRKVMA